MSDDPVNGSPADPCLYRQPDPVAAWLEDGEPPTVPQPIQDATALLAGSLPTNEDGQVFAGLDAAAPWADLEAGWVEPERLARYLVERLHGAGLLRQNGDSDA